MTHKSQTSSHYFCHSTRKGEEGKREKERNVSFLLWGAVYRSRISVSNTKQSVSYATDLLLKIFASPPPPPFFFLPSCFEWPTWKTNTTCKKRAQEGHNQHINLWSALVFEPVILHALWNGISYLMVIMHSLIFHMVKLAMPHWITMNFSRAYMLSMLLYGNPFSQHHQCLSEIW